MKAKAHFSQPRFLPPAPGRRDIPAFSRWSTKRLRAEAVRLGMPQARHLTKAELIVNLTEAYWP